MLFTIGGVCLISSALLYFDPGATLHTSITGFVYNYGVSIYKTGAAIFNSITGFFYTTNPTDVAPLIDPNTPSTSSGISKYF
jgi:hypothetical protein